jgi:hypothetical protein
MSEKDKKDEARSHINEILSTYRVEDKRGVFKANDLSFRVLPVDGTETIPFYALMTDAQRMANAEGRVNTSLLLVRLFTDVDKDGNPNKYPLFKSIKMKFCEKFFKDYRRYERYPMGKKLAMWIERLVSLDNKGEVEPIRYYDLEKTLLLSKEDIAKLLIYICELSGFM